MAADVLAETAYAKINLALHIRRRREDGYHELETLFAFAADGDRLTAQPSDTLTLQIDGRFAQSLSNGSDNLVLRAAAALQNLLGTQKGAAIQLDKRLPIAAGIGGGSADAAAVLRLLPRLWELTPDPAALHALAADLGADVPACLASQTVRGEGVGDLLLPVAAGDFKGIPLLLVNPGVLCLTGPVFNAWDGIDRGPLGKGAIWQASLAGRNDLEAPACHLVPEIGAILATIARQAGVKLARMSGSGATCFALFDNEAQAQKAATAFAPLWTLTTKLR